MTESEIVELKGCLVKEWNEMPDDDWLKEICLESINRCDEILKLKQANKVMRRENDVLREKLNGH